MKKVSIALLMTVVVFLAGSALFVDGCGQSDAEKAQETYDQDVADLKAAVDELKKPDTFDSIDSLKAAFQNVQSAYDDAVASGRDVANARISQVEQAYNQLKEDVANISSDQTLSEKLDALNDAVQNFADELDKV